MYHFENKFFDNPMKCGGIDLLQLGEMICRPTTVIAPHDQPCYELTYVISGQGTVSTNGIPVSVKKDDCVISFPGDVHMITSDPSSPLRYAFCAFNSNESDNIWKNIISELVDCFRGTETRLVSLPEESGCFYDLFSEVTSDDFMSREMIGIKLSEFIVSLLRIKKKEYEKIYSPQIKNERMLAYQIRGYLDTHICEIKKLTELSSVFNYNYRYITKCFKKVTGTTLNEYYQKCKMQYSKVLLKDGYSVTQISEMLKYSSIHVFTRSFKHYFGLTPSEYRKKKKLEKV